MGLLDKFKKPFEKMGKGKGAKTLKVKDDKKILKQVQDDKSKEKKQEKTEPKVKLQDVSGQAGRVLLRPLQSEKNTDGMMYGKYAFEVAPSANKVAIKQAVKAIYKVDPVSVSVVNMRGKSVRFGRIQSQRKNWKKAIVTLKPGDKIEVFEGV